MQFNNVMVPIDGSQLSNVAVEIALHSAGTFETHLTFVHVVDPSQVIRFGTVDEEGELMKATAMGELALGMAADMAKNNGTDYETKLVEGDTAKVLIEMSKNQNMIIMSIAGRTGLRSGRIGSIARKVIENSFCPVLTIKSGSKKIEDVLLPVSKENIAAIDIAIDTVKRINGKLTVMSVKGHKIEDAEGMANSVAAKCKSQGINVDTIVSEGDALDAIVGVSGKYDLIIMGVEKAGSLKEILHGGLTERVVTLAACPVTVVRDF